MNTEVAINIIVKVLIALGAGVAAKYGISDASQQQIALAAAGALVAGGSAAYGIFSHWGMKKVPQNATLLGTQAGAGSAPKSGVANPQAAQAVRPADRR